MIHNKYMETLLKNKYEEFKIYSRLNKKYINQFNNDFAKKYPNAYKYALDQVCKSKFTEAKTDANAETKADAETKAETETKTDENTNEIKQKQTDPVISKYYKEIMRKIHPDKNNGQLNEKHGEICKAYDDRDILKLILLGYELGFKNYEGDLDDILTQLFTKISAIQETISWKYGISSQAKKDDIMKQQEIAYQIITSRITINQKRD